MPVHAQLSDDGPLSGVTVLDLSRLAPGPYGSMLLAALGADVIAVTGGSGGAPVPDLHRGKRIITLDLKSPRGVAALHRLVTRVDVVIEGFRPGVAARIGAGYDELQAINPRIVYCSLTGYGQQGPLSSVSGHDINYLAMAGFLGAMGPADGPPAIPLNLLADFAGGGLFAAFGILAGIIDQRQTGRGSHIDATMVDGVMSLMSMWYPAWRSGVLGGRGEGLTTGSTPFYRTYECSDGRFVAVGAYEPPFFAELWSGLDLDGDPPDHFDRSNWATIEEALASSFAAKARDHWAAHFERRDACVTPVLDPDEVWEHPQVQARHPGSHDRRVPLAPLFTGTSRRAPASEPLQDQTAEVLSEMGFDESEIAEVVTANEGIATPSVPWPPI